MGTIELQDATIGYLDQKWPNPYDSPTGSRSVYVKMDCRMVWAQSKGVDLHRILDADSCFFASIPPTRLHPESKFT